VAVEIRSQEPSDEDAVWAILEAVVRAGDTFMNEPESDREEVFATWQGPATHNYVAELDGEIAGAYLLRPTQPGLGAHVANASFAVSPDARGHGVGRAMGEHALAEAERLGFRAMQFNAVVSTNESAIALWKSLGFEEVGRIPEAFRQGEGHVDTLVMHRAL
jgi:L-amino acid N-acyltransferase YncA